MHFSDRLSAQIKTKKSCLMLGIDPNWEKIKKLKITSDELRMSANAAQKAEIYERFACEMITACADYICGIKPQLAYFEALGSVGIKALENVLSYTRKNHSELIILMDAKRGDIGSTCEAYAHTFLSPESALSGDAVTVAPYMGTDSLEPFFFQAAQHNGGVFVLLKTSNPSSSQIQDLKLENGKTVAEFWGENLAKISPMVSGESKGDFTNVGVVVGATQGADLAKFRTIGPKNWILAPGVGAQGGSVKDVLAAQDADGLGVIIPVSRGILYASDEKDYLEAAKAAVKQLWEAQKR